MSLSTAEPPPDAELHAAGKHVTLHVPPSEHAQKTAAASGAGAAAAAAAQKASPHGGDAGATLTTPPQTAQQDGNDYAHIWQCTLHRADQDCHVKDNECNAKRQCHTLPGKHAASAGGACVISDRNRPVTLSSADAEEFYSSGMGAFHSHLPEELALQAHDRLPDVTLPRAKHPTVAAPGAAAPAHTKHAPTCSFAKTRFYVLDKDAVLKEVTSAHARDGHQCEVRQGAEHTRHAATLDFRTFKH